MRSPSSPSRIVDALRHQHAALDRVIELADVARPRVIEQRLQRRRLEAAEVLPIALRVLPQEVRRQRRDVLAPLAQRRQLDFDRVQAEQQILTETSGRRLLRRGWSWSPRRCGR